MHIGFCGTLQDHSNRSPPGQPGQCASTPGQQRQSREACDAIQGRLLGMEVTLSQEGSSCPLTMKIHDYTDIAVNISAHSAFIVTLKAHRCSFILCFSCVDILQVSHIGPNLCVRIPTLAYTHARSIHNVHHDHVVHVNTFANCCMHSFIHSFVRSFVRSFVCLFVCLFVCSFVCLLVWWSVCLFCLFVCQFDCWFGLFVCLFVHSLVCLFIHSLTYSLTH